MPIKRDNTKRKGRGRAGRSQPVQSASSSSLLLHHHRRKNIHVKIVVFYYV